MYDKGNDGDKYEASKQSKSSWLAYGGPIHISGEEGRPVRSGVMGWNQSDSRFP